MYFDPQYPNIFYVVSRSKKVIHTLPALIKSDDQGQTWEEIIRLSSPYIEDPDPSINGEHYLYEDVVLAINPHNSDILYLGS